MSERAQRIPPQNIEAEESVIGAVLLDATVLPRLAEQIGAADFYREAHRRIWAAMVDLIGRQEPIDLVTLADRLRARNELAECGGAAYLAELVERVPTAANAGYYASLVRRDADRRRVIGVATELALEVYENAADLHEYLPDRLSPLLDVVSDQSGTPAVADLLVDAMAALAERAEGRGGDLISTGLLDLDHLLGGGWMPGNFSIVAGRPSMGKSSFADTSLLAAARAGIPAGLCSLEQRGRLCVYRLLAKLTGDVSVHRIVTGRLAPHEHGRVTRAAEELGRLPLAIKDRRSLPNWSAIQLAIRRMASEGVRLVVVDHLHLIDLPGRAAEPEKISLVVREMAELAKLLNIELILLVQINREAEREKDHRPRISQLMGSSAIESNADDIVLLYRPYKYDKDADPQLCEAIVAKQRNGPTGTAELRFKPETTMFTDWLKQPDLF